MTQTHFSSIQENINYNILRGKITKALCEFAIASIEPIKDKATTQRIVPSIADPTDPSKTLFKAWRTDFEIDGYKGHFMVSLQTEKNKWEDRTRKYVRIYSHAYNESKNAYAPEPIMTEIWKCGAEEQTWETFLEELRNYKAQYDHLPTSEEVDKYLDECEEIKKTYEDFEEKRKAFNVLGGEYLNEAPSRWRVRG